MEPEPLPDWAQNPGLLPRLLWIVLPACGSALLLAVTNQLCWDVAVVPFLWVLPLALYLLTFIICFDHPRWYSRAVFMPLLAACVVGMAWQVDSLQLRYVLPLFAGGATSAGVSSVGSLIDGPPVVRKARLVPTPHRRLRANCGRGRLPGP